MKEKKFVTSHRIRVKKAKMALADSPEKISCFDRQAFVKFYLLEDIVALYQYRLRNEEAKMLTTRAGEMTRERNIEKFKAIITVFESAIEVAWGAITSGKYKVVRRAVKEYALQTAVGDIKYLPKLRSLAVEMLKELSDEMLVMAEEQATLNRSLDDIEKREKAYMNQSSMPSSAEITKLIESLEDIIPDEKPKRKFNYNN